MIVIDTPSGEIELDDPRCTVCGRFIPFVPLPPVWCYDGWSPRWQTTCDPHKRT